MEQKLIFTNDVKQALTGLLDSMHPTQVVVVADENTAQQCVPLIEPLADCPVIAIAAGDDHKTLESLALVWQGLTDAGATRHAVVVNVGGGMVTDLGGFAAATYKRGIRFINIPTTVLAAVDASVGGKTGINFAGLKNQVGVFRQADAVIISTLFFATLPPAERLSGYAEMLKHALIGSLDMGHALNYDHRSLTLDSLRQSIHVKEVIVAQDPEEKGLRKALNLGHTVGHAFEELAIERDAPIPHGYAVAYGLVVELLLSAMKTEFPRPLMYQVARFVKENYGQYSLDCKQYDRLIALMRHDKKNATADQINFTLLRSPGDLALDSIATADEIKQALDLYRDM